MTIMGIDPGCEWNGVADAGGGLHTIRVKTTNRGARAAEISRRLANIEAWSAVKAEIAVLEGYAYGVGKKSLTRSAEAKGAILLTLYECGVEVCEVPPTSAKLFLTGDGTSSKEEMAAVLIDAVPEVAGPDLDEHQVDAAALRMMGMVHYDGLRSDLFHYPAVEAVKWPKIARRG